jgi:hypothetical protein
MFIAQPDIPVPRDRNVYRAAALARTVAGAAQAQHTTLPGEKLAAAMVARLAKGVMALDEEIAELDTLIEARFRKHPLAGLIVSLPGIGTSLGAEFIAATGGDMAVFGSAWPPGRLRQPGQSDGRRLGAATSTRRRSK